MMKKYCLYFLMIILLTCSAIGGATTNTLLQQSVLDAGLQAEGTGQWQRAINIYLDMLLIHPDRVDLWIRIAHIEHQLKHDQLTIAAYEHAILAQPDNASLRKLLSEIYAGLNDKKNALIQLQEAVKLAPNNFSYTESLAKIANWNNATELALQAYKKALQGLTPEQDKPKYIAFTQQISQLEMQLKKEDKVLTTPIVLSAFEAYLKAANDASSAHQYTAAIQSLKKAIAIKPKQANLYKKISEIYAMMQQKQKALEYITLALRHDPNNIEYLRAKAKLASWNNQAQVAIDSYCQLLALRPHDEDAMLSLAHMYGSLGKTDKSLIAYQQLLNEYPKNADGWLYYAETLSWVQNYIQAMQALNRYVALKGQNLLYIKTKARILGLAGRYRSSLIMNTPILQQSPHDVYALKTQSIDLIRAFQLENALFFLKQADHWAPKNDNQLRDLKNIIRTPIRSNGNLEGDYTWATDTTAIFDAPISGQYFVTPTFAIIGQGLYERLTANVNSGLETIQGKGSIFDESARFGFSTQMFSTNFSALLGDLQIQNGGNYAIYEAKLQTNLTDQAQISIDSFYDLFRPYLIPQTPKSVSLQVREQRTSVVLDWQPFLQKNLNVLTSYSTLSDFNAYWHINVWPKARVFGSEHWLVTLGMDSDIWTFNRRATDGYYSPLLFQGYEGTIELYHAITSDIGYSLAGGFGIQKDETLPHFFYEEDLNARLIYGIFSDFQVQIKGGYTLRTYPTNKYQCRVVSLVLTQRF